MLGRLDAMRLPTADPSARAAIGTNSRLSSLTGPDQPDEAKIQANVKEIANGDRQHWS